MSTTSLGGLAGKARKVHQRDQAERLFADQLIDEYLEPKSPSKTPRRHVPIRKRSDFLPTYLADDDLSESGTGGQLAWGWTEGEKSVRRGRRVVWSTSQRERSERSGIRFPEQARISSNSNDESSSPSPVIRMPRRSGSRMPLGWSQQPQPQNRDRLTWRGFITGCAIGGAAAAFVLTVLSATFG